MTSKSTPPTDKTHARASEPEAFSLLDPASDAPDDEPLPSPLGHLPRLFATPAGPDDVEGWTVVLAAYREGEPWACQTLIESVIDAMAKQCAAAMLKRPHDKEALQDAIIKVWTGRRTFQGDLDAFRAWTHVVMQNEIAYQKRTRGRRAAREVLSDVLPEVAVTESPLDLLEKSREKAFLDKSIPRLTEKQQRVVNLRLEGLAVTEIARICSEEEHEEITKQTVSERLRCAVRQLREMYHAPPIRPGIAPAPMSLLDLVAMVARWLPAHPLWGDLATRQRMEWTVLHAHATHQRVPPHARAADEAMAEVARLKWVAERARKAAEDTAVESAEKGEGPEGGG